MSIKSNKLVTMFVTSALFLSMITVLSVQSVSAQGFGIGSCIVNCIGGEQGPQGPQGPKGDQGPPGADGKNGADGTNGIDGKNGADGKDGATGPAGPAGPQGIQGPQGEKGEQGIQGEPGDDCPNVSTLQTEEIFGYSADVYPDNGASGVCTPDPASTTP